MNNSYHRFLVTADAADTNVHFKNKLNSLKEFAEKKVHPNVSFTCYNGSDDVSRQTLAFLPRLGSLPFY
jgi:hypothetical protein